MNQQLSSVTCNRNYIAPLVCGELNLCLRFDIKPNTEKKVDAVGCYKNNDGAYIVYRQHPDGTVDTISESKSREEMYDSFWSWTRDHVNEKVNSLEGDKQAKFNRNANTKMQIIRAILGVRDYTEQDSQLFEGIEVPTPSLNFNTLKPNHCGYSHDEKGFYFFHNYPAEFGNDGERYTKRIIGKKGELVSIEAMREVYRFMEDTAEQCVARNMKAKGLTATTKAIVENVMHLFHPYKVLVSWPVFKHRGDDLCIAMFVCNDTGIPVALDMPEYEVDVNLRSGEIIEVIPIDSAGSTFLQKDFIDGYRPFTSFRLWLCFDMNRYAYIGRENNLQMEMYGHYIEDILKCAPVAHYQFYKQMSIPTEHYQIRVDGDAVVKVVDFLRADDLDGLNAYLKENGLNPINREEYNAMQAEYATYREELKKRNINPDNTPYGVKTDKGTVYSISENSLVRLHAATRTEIDDFAVSWSPITKENIEQMNNS